ncbi:MAG TPA: glutaminyl-peptide cyclotransferase [Planctomycetota bacterium]|nr:glutaminyl-peptide cyclotransferase [Planctomycetota bacterium]
MAKSTGSGLKDSVSPVPGAAGRRFLVPAVVLAFLVGGVLAWLVFRQASAPVGGYRILATHPHKSQKTYTQGLEVVEGLLFESTGQNGEADWRLVDLASGSILAIPGSNHEHRYGLSAEHFGEGITVWRKQKLIQLTWRSRVGFTWDVTPIFDGLKRVTAQPQKFSYPTDVKEGWGLTQDATRLIMSTGDPDGRLHFLDPETLERVGTLVVKDGGKPVERLNELEHVDGYVYANVYQTNHIVKIDLKTGEVVMRYDMKGLLTKDAASKLKPDEVLNGIAYDATRKVFLVTGKNWPHLFEVEFTNP